MLISLVGLIVFIYFSEPAADFLNTNPFYFLIGGVTILAIVAIGNLEAITYGVLPQVPAYGFLIFEFSKVFLGLFTVFILKMGLLGAMSSVFLAYLIQTLVLTIFLREELGKGFDLAIVRGWFKRLWLPIASNLALVLSGLDVIIITLLTDSSEPIALLKASQVIATTISYSSVMASALYPKLLSGGGKRDI